MTTYVDRHGLLWDATDDGAWLIRRGEFGWEGMKSAIEMAHGPLKLYEPEVN